VLKIARDGSVTDSADVREHPGTGEPVTAVEHPADGTMSPPVSNDPAPGEPEPVQVTQLPAGELAVPEGDVQAPGAAPEPAPAVPPRVPPRRPPAAAGG
jgi:hypothetical protein